MKLFLYYSLHAFLNQLRKLMKTWVLVLILACGLIGGLIGYGAASLVEVSEETYAEIEEESTPDILQELPEDITAGDITELIAGGVIAVRMVDRFQDIKDAEAQERVNVRAKDKAAWAKSAILNIARSGKFSSDRTIQDYVDDIWHLEKMRVK